MNSQNAFTDAFFCCIVVHCENSSFFGGIAVTMPNGTLVTLNTNVSRDLEYGIIVGQPGEGVSSQESPEAYLIRLFNQSGYRGGNWYKPNQFKREGLPLTPLAQEILLSALKWMTKNEKKLEGKIQKFKKLALED